MNDFANTESAVRDFEAYLAALLDAAFGTALHLTRHRDDAEDLVQAAALQAFRAFASFQAGTNFKAWFFRILTNLFITPLWPIMPLTEGQSTRARRPPEEIARTLAQP